MKTLRVLIAEDNENDYYDVARHLKKETPDFPFKVEIAHAPDRREYERLLREFNCDIILLDLRLQDLAGEQALEMARRLKPDTPIIVLTGSIGDDQAATVAVQYGAADYLIKDRRARLKQAIQTAHERHDQKLALDKLKGLDLLHTLAAGVGHDLNNILGTIVAAAQLLTLGKEATSEEERIEAERAKEKALNLIVSSAMRGGEMVKQMMVVARGGENSPYRSVTAEYLLTEIGQMLREKAFSTIVRSPPAKIDVGTWRVRCDSTRIYQVLLNLCVNARDAMPDGGELHLSAYNVTKRKDRDGYDGNFVCFTVSDTGKGIPEEVLPKIFDAFFTTKKNGRGIGLHIVTETLKDHGGHIDVKTSPHGTTFYVYLPADQPQKPKPKFDGGGKTIVLVDDDRFFLTAIQMHLEAVNYRVLPAGNGPEALNHFRSEQKIDLLLTDLTMPIMCGRELVRNLRSMNFNLPVIFMSGIDAEIPGELEAAAVLKKPIPIPDLLETLKRVSPN